MLVSRDSVLVNRDSVPVSTLTMPAGLLYYKFLQYILSINTDYLEIHQYYQNGIDNNRHT